jgi:threonyl-tRNA synthetase
VTADKLELYRRHSRDGGTLSFYSQEDFTDLCAGPHLISTDPIRAVKLNRQHGALQLGNEKNKMPRAASTVSRSPKNPSLTNTLRAMEEAKKRDTASWGVSSGCFALMTEGPSSRSFCQRHEFSRMSDQLLREIHTRHGYVEMAKPRLFSAARCGSARGTGGHYEKIIVYHR